MSANILVFDSGVGGLSILEAIRERLPHANYCYLFDNARLPYGELEEQDLINGCVSLIGKMALLFKADILVVACNSASTLVLPALRETLAIPVVGVVPAIKPAAKYSRLKHIGLLATPGTVNRSYTQTLIDTFAADCRVEKFGSSELVYIAEQKMAQVAINSDDLQRILEPIKRSGIDTLVLGCTHFPILKQELQTHLGEGVLLLDSSAAIAARVASFISERYEQREGQACQALYTTRNISDGLKRTLATWGFSTITSVSMQVSS